MCRFAHPNRPPLPASLGGHAVVQKKGLGFRSCIVWLYELATPLCCSTKTTAAVVCVAQPWFGRLAPAGAPATLAACADVLRVCLLGRLWVWV